MKKQSLICRNTSKQCTTDLVSTPLLQLHCCQFETGELSDEICSPIRYFVWAIRTGYRGILKKYDYLLISGSQKELLQSADLAVLLTATSDPVGIGGEVDGVDPLRNPDDDGVFRKDNSEYFFTNLLFFFSRSRKISSCVGVKEL